MVGGQIALILTGKGIPFPKNRRPKIPPKETVHPDRLRKQTEQLLVIQKLPKIDPEGQQRQVTKK